MRYQITMSGGEKYFILESEAVNIAKGDMKGLVLVPSVKGYINLSFVQSVVPEDKIDRSKISKGRLHDGTLVIKKFGEWKDALYPEIKLDYRYYTELSTDEIMTEEEYLQYKNKKEHLLKSPSQKILNCIICKGTGIVPFHGDYTYSETDKMCSCVSEEIKGKDIIISN